jgi:hypothetical protein
MKTIPVILVCVLCAVLAMPAHAQKDKDKPGQGRGGPKNAGDDGPGQSKGQGRDDNSGRGNLPGNPGIAATPAGPRVGVPQVNVVVTERDRSAIYGYYRPLYAAGNCPPGLAKKNNGCLPPGQAKKLWAVGQPLPAGVAYYPLPGPLLGQLTAAPAGYEYVRVANDILLMAIGTRLVAGAVADLSSM